MLEDTSTSIRMSLDKRRREVFPLPLSCNDPFVPRNTTSAILFAFLFSLKNSRDDDENGKKNEEPTNRRCVES